MQDVQDHRLMFKIVEFYRNSYCYSSVCWQFPGIISAQQCCTLRDWWLPPFKETWPAQQPLNQTQ